MNTTKYEPCLYSGLLKNKYVIFLLPKLGVFAVAATDTLTAKLPIKLLNDQMQIYVRHYYQIQWRGQICTFLKS